MRAVPRVGLERGRGRARVRPRVGDALAEMETELQKVSWPSLSDAWQSTLVVSGFTALIVVLVFSYDIVIKGIIELVGPKGAV